MADADDLKAVLAALRTLRIKQVGWNEVRIHGAVAEVLAQHGIVAEHEVRLGGRMRPDFLTASGTVIEIKKGRPPITPTLAQLTRYAASDRVQRIILVAERGLPAVPSDVGGKGLVQVPLYASWGFVV